MSAELWRAGWTHYDVEKRSAVCSVCHRRFRVLVDESLRSHGPRNNLCAGSWEPRAYQPAATRGGEL